MLTPTDVDTLEMLVESHTLHEITEALSVIALERSDYMRRSWQDFRTAQQWDTAGRQLEMLSKKMWV